MASGIDWSAPSLIKVGENGGLQLEIPEKAVKGLDLTEGDVLCFTGFENGTVEVWPVKKGTYSSLDDAGAAAEAMQRAGKDSE